MDYILHIGILVCIYTIITVSTNLLVGLSNQISLGQAAFLGIGAYITALCTILLNLSLIPTLIIVMIVNALLSFLLAISSIKLKGDFFILATLAFQFIIYSILYNWKDVTQGSAGITGIPYPNIFYLIDINTNLSFLILAVFFTLITLILFYRFFYSPFGLALKAMREDEIALQTLGRNTKNLKVWSFVISSSFIGWASYLYASYMSYINPVGFNLEESIFILIAVLIGGIGNLKGSVTGALFVILLPEILRFVGLPDGIAAPVHQIIYGSILIVLMFFRPGGLFGNLEFK
ncbi:MAG: branched-chain amino acid ABC transporter permease [Bacteroidetes bacterium]|nr:branched-chain amino acid ABC transporter permease [Bacteroidota bacterium]